AHATSVRVVTASGPRSDAPAPLPKVLFYELEWSAFGVHAADPTCRSPSAVPVGRKSLLGGGPAAQSDHRAVSLHDKDHPA
ncbi:MAG: hypothetical protein WBC54_01435, partial [Rhodococcus sp. (in: high G+C Gram-positive bacteria)]